uniref:Uncharacterized protein n=1 Tax=Anguilla anguilla TaxID=7936 RepID=A0A0E9QBC5_ANGAN
MFDLVSNTHCGLNLSILQPF